MNKSLVRKGLVLGIILLFVGAGVVPNISGDEPVNASYDHEAAYNYAQKYWDEVCSDGYFWDSPSTYISLDPGTDITEMAGYDCAHFVSCCVGYESNEQGGGLEVPSIVPPTYGEPGAVNLGNWLIDNGNAIEVGSIDNLQMGDVIIYTWSNGGHHAVLYLGGGKVASHTSCVWNADWQLDPENTESYRFIHVTATGIHTGGPDSFGYTFIDNAIPSGPSYDWIEISESGTEVLSNSDDSWVENIDIGFFFNYYGTDYSQLAISNNGLLFSGGTTWEYVNEPIGQSPSVHGFIAPFWDDIITYDSRGAGTIYYQTIGTAPNRMFIVEWFDNYHYWDSDSGVTFEALLYEGSNNIKFQYQDVDFGNVYSAVPGDNPPYNNGGSATVGIEGPYGDVGLQYSYNEEVINSELAILFEFPQFVGTNLFLSKQAPANKDHGSLMTYSLHYHNFGDTAAENVVIEDTLPTEVEFISASDGGSYDSNSGKISWDIGSLVPLGHGYRTLTVRILQSVPIGTIIQNNALISTSNIEVRYDDNEANAHTAVTGSNLPPDVGVEPNNGGSTPSIYYGTPTTFTYHSSQYVSEVDIRISIDDGGPDILGSMIGGPPDWTYTTTFYPRHGAATIMYTMYCSDQPPYSTDFDVRNMPVFNDNLINANNILEYIEYKTPTSPMLSETDIGDRFISAGFNNGVNPGFLVATAYHEGNFGTAGWAVSHPECHNTMGWGIPSGSTPPDAINCVESWGDMIERVAERIANGPYYYNAGWYTVEQIREIYAASPASSTIVFYMNELYYQSCGNELGFNIYIDPAGYIYNIETGERIEGASVWLQRPDGTGDWENVPTGQTPSIMQPDVNPLITGEDGQYQWDVLEGSYRVHVEAPSYYPEDSIVVSIPPPVTDLHVGLIRMNQPPVAIVFAPEIGFVGSPITFDGTASYDSDGYIINWSWDFGDSEDGNGEIVIHTYSLPGNYTVTLTVTDNDELINTIQKTIEVLLPAVIDIDPDTLNRNSGGNWITCYIEFPEGYDVEDINISTILLNATIAAESHPTNISDYDNDGIPDLMVKFDRQDVIEILEPGDNVAITVTGKLFDGTLFEGVDYITVI